MTVPEILLRSNTLSSDYLEHYALLPIRIEQDRLLFATWRDRIDQQVLDHLGLLFGAEPVAVHVPEEEGRAAIRRAYGGDAATAEELIAILDEGRSGSSGSDARLEDLRSQANEAPVVRLVNLLLLEALEARASDVHLEGHADGLRVRYRIDGVLQDAPSPPPHMKAAVVSRLKIMAELDIAERRVPQDGRIRLRLQDRQVDVRLATLPTLHGESVVLRLLEASGHRLALSELGMGDVARGRFNKLIDQPHGVLLATGPTGSGKTTTLYAALERLRTGREKIVTVEDPVEYALEGIAQVPVNRKSGVTFATALRSILRQDPDVLLVGEMRDTETAEICTQAALTGHLVLSTLHTNDAPSALVRLLDLGIEPYLVASTVEAVVAQRLVRIVCGECSEMEVAEPAIVNEMAAAGQPVEAVRQGKGCRACRHTGFRGRTGIYELLVVDEDIRREVVKRRQAAAIHHLAVKKGMCALRADGWRQVAAGVTTPEEVLRVT